MSIVRPESLPRRRVLGETIKKLEGNFQILTDLGENQRLKGGKGRLAYRGGKYLLRGIWLP